MPAWPLPSSIPEHVRCNIPSTTQVQLPAALLQPLADLNTQPCHTINIQWSLYLGQSLWIQTHNANVQQQV